MASFSNNLPIVPFGSRVLRLQSPAIAGTDVKVFQRLYDTMLELMDPPQGPMGSRIPITGIFDHSSQQAAYNIQSYFGIAVDGIVDRQTYRIMGQDNSAYGGPAFGSRSLSIGTHGGDVRVLQNRLNCLRYASINNQPANGIFGSSTTPAVLAFQGDNIVYRHWDISFDGSVGPNTFEILWITSFTGGRDLGEGDNGFDTVGLQVILQNLGFYLGRIDGYFGRATREAVRAFQKAFGITVDGVAGSETFYALGRSNPVFWYSADLYPRQRIGNLHTIREISSTIDPINGDKNPYGVILAPNTFDDTQTVLKHGDVLVSNISNAKGIMGLGSTLERIVQGKPHRFFAGAMAPIAISTSNLGATWIADYGFNPNGSQGIVQVISANGLLFSGGDIRRDLFAGPWGMQFNFGEFYGLPVAFFSTNVLSGTIDRFTGFHPPNFNEDSITVQIGSGFAHIGTTINTVYGPQGMIWLPMGDALYIADGANDSISVLAPVSTGENDMGSGLTIYQGPPLNKPAGLGFNPENGHLIAVNQGDNRAIEINPRTGRLVSSRTLDKTPVNPVTGAGSALFGIYVALDEDGELALYFTNDNTNTVNVLMR
ncbi:MAG: peptidoglycan-binding protein [Sulfobacillus thermotolerans]|nr:peptidoglycan-binding protein [Sulfobacillus thermotolerans]